MHPPISSHSVGGAGVVVGVPPEGVLLMRTLSSKAPRSPGVLLVNVSWAGQ